MGGGLVLRRKGDSSIKREFVLGLITSCGKYLLLHRLRQTR